MRGGRRQIAHPLPALMIWRPPFWAAGAPGAQPEAHPLAPDPGPRHHRGGQGTGRQATGVRVCVRACVCVCVCVCVRARACLAMRAHKGEWEGECATKGRIPGGGAHPALSFPDEMPPSANAPYTSRRTPPPSPTSRAPARPTGSCFSSASRTPWGSCQRSRTPPKRPPSRRWPPRASTLCPSRRRRTRPARTPRPRRRRQGRRCWRCEGGARGRGLARPRSAGAAAAASRARACAAAARVADAGRRTAEVVKKKTPTSKGSDRLGVGCLRRGGRPWRFLRCLPPASGKG